MDPFSGSDPDPGFLLPRFDPDPVNIKPDLRCLVTPGDCMSEENVKRLTYPRLLNF